VDVADGELTVRTVDGGRWTVDGGQGKRIKVVLKSLVFETKQSQESVSFLATLGMTRSLGISAEKNGLF